MPARLATMAGMSWKRRIVFAAGGLLLLAVIYFGVSWFIVGQALVAEVTEIEQRPEDLGLTYEEVEFTPRGWPDITLSGWWLPADDPKATIVRVHGIDTNKGDRLGLTQAMVEGGYSVLAFDLRGHGESDKAPMGAGLDERADVLGAIDYLFAERGAVNGEVFLHGLSYGGAIALLAGVEDSRVNGVFSDTAFANLADLITQEVSGRTIVPSWGAAILLPGLVWMAQLTRGIDINEMRPSEAAGQYAYPIGLAHCRFDDRIPIEHLARIRLALTVPPRLTIYEGCVHGEAWNDFPVNYEALMLDYYDERLGLFGQPWP